MKQRNLRDLFRKARLFGLLAAAVFAIAALAAALGGEPSQTALNREMESLDITVLSPREAKGIVLYREESREYSYDYIPRHLRAETVEDVAAVIFCREEEEAVKIYKSGRIGCVRSLTMKFFDRKQGKTLELKVFRGGQPPVKEKGSGSGSLCGSPPSPREITRWVEALAQTP